MGKKTNAKESNKKRNKKKKKRGIFKKFILTIFIIILIAGLVVGGYFGYNYYRLMQEMEGKEFDPLSATALGIDPEILKNIGRINVLLLGESGIGDGYKLTDTIMIASYNPQTQQASILSIPRDTYVGKNFF